MKKIRIAALFIFAFSIGLFFSQCQRTPGNVQVNLANLPYPKLSDYGFFTGRMIQHIPNEGVLPYDLITPLFSDYAGKKRFVWMPEGTTAQYTEQDAFDFPVGTVLIKTFYYPSDFRKPNEKKQILETRLLVHLEDGWEAYPYIWNSRGTEAKLSWVGGEKKVSWIDESGEKQTLNYLIPNRNQCKSCHEKKGEMVPIGPKARNLNMDFNYPEGVKNQLAKWQSVGYLTGLEKAPEDVYAVANYQDESESINRRARAYLDINCGHCHNPKGPAHTSGLNLDYWEENASRLGVCKAPVAAGRGSGNRPFGIYPSRPEGSIILFRMESTNPGIMMPEIGRRLAHTEGVELVREWIAEMQPSEVCP